MLDPEPCELCGKLSKLVDCIIEGTMISACGECSKFGSKIEPPKEEKSVVRRKIPLMEEKEFISKNYSQKIKQAREKLDLKQQELAQKIAEKESVIHSLESGHLEPSFDLAKKLESFLNIRLIDTYEKPNTKISFTDTSVTIGDLLKFKKK